MSTKVDYSAEEKMRGAAIRLWQKTYGCGRKHANT
jgi:hypothetical protein